MSLESLRYCFFKFAALMTDAQVWLSVASCLANSSAVEPTDVSRRAFGDTLIDRGGLTSITIAAPAQKSVFKLLDDVDRLIRRPRIGNKNFDWQFLLKD